MRQCYTGIGGLIVEVERVPIGLGRISAWKNRIVHVAMTGFCGLDVPLREVTTGGMCALLHRPGRIHAVTILIRILPYADP